MKIVSALLLLAASSIEGQHLHGSSPKLNVNDMLQDNHLMTNDMADVSALRKKKTDKCTRIKLYWKKGYKWQGSKKEKKWCMEGHKDGETVEIKKCSSSSKQKFKFIGDDQIQSCKDKDLCFVLSGKFAKLDKCSSSKKQKFKKKGKDKKFTLEPKSKKGCLTQRHHPKSGERVRVESCKAAGKDETEYWNTY